MYENNYPNNYETQNTMNNSSTSYQAGSEPERTGSAAGPGNTYHYGESEMPKAPNPPKKTMGTGRKIALGICVGLLFGIFAGIGFEAVTTASGLVKDNLQAEGQTSEAAEETVPAEENVIASTTTAEVSGTSVVQTTVTDVTEVVKNVMPSVVSVSNRYVETTSFWGQQYSSEGVSSGSGIIVGQNDTELLLVTNYHVIEEATELTVQFCDSSQVQAQVKGYDEDKDLAVIAVQLSDIESDTMSAIAIATLGDSNELTVGEPVIAIGNALGYGQSVTTGVVSALDRPIAVSDVSAQTGDAEVNTFIQTDAAINPGNSGGALLNIKGEVIGINSNKIGGSTVEGMGYAIPISDAKPIIEELMTKETRVRVADENKGYLGITGIDVVDEYAEVYGMPKGVYVSSVTEGSGADAAGLIKGDIITALNGETVESMEELKEELSYYEAGTTVELTIMQGSPTGYQAKTVSVTLGVVPAASTQ